MIVEVSELNYSTEMGEGGSKIIAFGETVREYNVQGYGLMIEPNLEVGYKSMLANGHSLNARYSSVFEEGIPLMVGDVLRCYIISMPRGGRWLYLILQDFALRQWNSAGGVWPFSSPEFTRVMNESKGRICVSFQ